MKLCVISPLSHLDLASFGSGIHMALTHIVHQDEQYVKAYQRFKNKGEYVILDNSAFELEQQGKGLDPKPVLEASKLVGADEIIATDVLCHGPETIKSTRNFIKEFLSFYGEEIRLEKFVPKIMAVPQGQSIQEWIDCYTTLLLTEGVDVIGFSKIAIPTCFGGPNARKVDGGVTQSRLKLYDYLDKHYLWPSQLGRACTDIHLLGGDSWSGFELIQVCNKWPKAIRSNDTSAPVWYGANGIAFDPFTGKASKFLIEKPDLENRIQTTAEKIETNLSLIMKNIATLLKCTKED